MGVGVGVGVGECGGGGGGGARSQRSLTASRDVRHACSGGVQERGRTSKATEAGRALGGACPWPAQRCTEGGSSPMPASGRWQAA